MTRVDSAQWPADMNRTPHPDISVPLTWRVVYRETFRSKKRSEPDTNVMYYFTEDLQAAMDACEHRDHTHLKDGKAICNDCWREVAHG